jgi:hypothetical protein
MNRHAFKPVFKTAALLSGFLAISSFCVIASTETAEVPASKPAATSGKPAIATVAPLQAAQQKVDNYAAKYKAWVAGKNQSFEPVLTAGQDAAASFLMVAEGMEDTKFEELKQKMTGYLVIRDEVIAIVPDAPFLAEQMKLHGQPQDVAFFHLMAQTLNGYWPVTQEQLQDMSGCTRFGSHDLVRLYGAWKQFQQLYPKSYTAALKEQSSLLLADIEDQLLNSQTACDGPDDVADEFETFIKAYPASPLTPKIKKRLEEVRGKQSNMRFFQGVKYMEEPEAPSLNPTQDSEP